MRSLLATLLVSATVLTSIAARADDDATTTLKAQPEPERTWYGGQTLAIDGAAIALAIGAGASTQNQAVANALATMSLATYVLGGPVVHLVHDRGGVAAGDLALRVALPIAGTLLGAELGNAVSPASASTCDSDGPCGGGLPGAIIGLGVGVLTASILDATVLAYEPAAPRNVSTHRPTPLRIAPSLALVPQGREGAVGTVGASGSF
jgi:hypothetical protein